MSTLRQPIGPLPGAPRSPNEPDARPLFRVSRGRPHARVVQGRRNAVHGHRNAPGAVRGVEFIDRPPAVPAVQNGHVATAACRQRDGTRRGCGIHEWLFEIHVNTSHAQPGKVTTERSIDCARAVMCEEPPDQLTGAPCVSLTRRYGSAGTGGAGAHNRQAAIAPRPIA
jgi:hypothetical protein